MITLPLNKCKYTLLDDEDICVLYEYGKWFCTDHGYAVTSRYIEGKNKRTYLHKVILERKIGRELVEGETVDHANRDRLDNRRGNLRVATRTQQAANTRQKKEGYAGVRKVSSSDNYNAYTSQNGKQIHIGMYATELEAAYAHDLEAKKIYGEFAYLNNVEPCDLKPILPVRCGATGATGIRQNKNGKYWGRAKRNGKEHCVGGMFGTVEEAIAARNKWLEENT